MICLNFCSIWYFSVEPKKKKLTHESLILTLKTDSFSVSIAVYIQKLRKV